MVSFRVFSHSKGFEANSSNGVASGKFRRPQKRFCRRFPQLVFTFVSQHLSPTSLLGQIPSASKKVLWRVPPTIQFFIFVSQHLSPRSLLGQSPSALNKVLWRAPPTILYSCLPTFVSQESLGANSVSFEKGSMEGSPNYSLYLSPNICLPVSQSSLRKRLCGRFPHIFFTFVSQSPSLFLEEVVWKVPPTFLFICRPVFFLKKVMWKVPPTILYICLPVFSCGRFLQPQLTSLLFEKSYVEGSPIYSPTALALDLQP